MQTELINSINGVFENEPIERAWLFGSFSRNEENEASDIDIVVRFSKPHNMSLVSYVHLINQLSDITGRKVDLVEDGYLRDFALESFEQDKVLIYERKTKG
jgi:predicted nucleotidyltransferase